LPTVANLPHNAAEPQTHGYWRGGLPGVSGMRINNPPQVANLPHNKIVAGCEGISAW